MHDGSRKLLGRCLIILESRPELVPRLADMIGNYELSVVPLGGIFAAVGVTLLLPTDKQASFIGVWANIHLGGGGQTEFCPNGSGGGG